MKPSKQVIAYARVSTTEQGKSGLGIEAQIEDMKRFASYHGIEIIDTRVEIVSGKYDLDRRPILKQAFKDAHKQGASILISKIDRLSRKASFIFNLMDSSTKYGSAKFIVAECGIDVSPLEIQLRASFAEEERRKIGERTKAAFAAKKARGEPLGMQLSSVSVHASRANKQSVISNKTEADNFALFMKPTISRMRKDGMSFHAIAEELNLHGNKTQRGGRWYAKTVANITTRW